MRRIVLFVLLAGCSSFQTTPAAEPIPREPVTVYATVGKTFDAAVTAAATVAPIKHTDRAGGVIVLEMARLTEADSRRYADCGRMGGTPIIADGGNVTVTVSESGGFAVVRAAALYTISAYRNPNPPRCVSTGVLENTMETAVKQQAEAR